MAERIATNVDRGELIELSIDGQPVSAYPGESIASVLLLNGHKSCYLTQSGRPRMMFCNMGTCYECRVKVKQDGRARWVLACKTPVQAQMEIETGVKLSQQFPARRDDV